MASTKGKLDTRSLGLELGVNLVKFLTGKEHLHYGIWAEGVDVNAGNLLAAQEAYTAKLLSLLPDGKGLRILDVGGGAGETARSLIALGHRPDVIVPSEQLAAKCVEKVGDLASVHRTKFEEFESTERFDVCLFSESLQYIKLETALAKASELLAPDGEIVIADCFRREQSHRDASGYRPVGGGHRLEQFLRAVDKASLHVISEEDITKAVAPSVEVEQLFFNFLGQSVQLVDRDFMSAYPRIWWIVIRIGRMFLGANRIDRISRKLLGRHRNRDSFCKYNRYLMLKVRPT